MRISDWSSDVCSSDLETAQADRRRRAPTRRWQTPCRSYDFPQNGAHRAGIGANDAERERDQFVPTGRHVIEHEPLQYPHINRLARLMRTEGFRLSGVWRGGLGAGQAHDNPHQPQYKTASDAGETPIN